MCTAFLLPFRDDASVRQIPSAIFGLSPVGGDARQSLIAAAAAALLGAAFFYLVWAAYYLVKKADGSGFGDIAMAAMLGAFLGPKGLIVGVILAYLLGTAYAALLLLALLIQRRTGDGEKTPLRDSLHALGLRAAPFGVFLGTAGIVSLFWGNSIWRWYLGFVL